jgi:2-oxoglutarate dehydrogenase E1 component
MPTGCAATSAPSSTRSNLSERPEVPDLELGFHSLIEADLKTSFHTGSWPPRSPDAGRNRRYLQRTYCGSIGVEYMHIADTNQRRWLQQRLEGTRGNYTPEAEDRLRLLDKLAAAEGMEKYLHSKYVGQKRFSLEGGESLIPLFDTLIRHSGSQGIKEMVIGMAHRGRLNVLVNILGKSPGELFAEFEASIAKDDPNRSGDVKYHMGFSSDVRPRAARCTWPWPSTPRTWKSSTRWWPARPAPVRPVSATIATSRSCRCWSTAMPPSPARAW